MNWTDTIEPRNNRELNLPDIEARLEVIQVIVRGPLTHDPRAPPVASQYNFIMQPLVTKEWNARAF